ncbi:cilia- and flagella-associated protein 206 [Astyanax mexicanus]|uniref:cilia- and flagella-associated protein 206 n=1 Tax=Astyanax mexicanus TaxID=7994 RepID=UPI0020CB2370|nr:cilia- and flagella-associated protein 206 [Astyanax mexicanus]
MLRLPLLAAPGTPPFLFTFLLATVKLYPAARDLLFIFILNKSAVFTPSMSRAHAESVIKNIIREIAQQCASKGDAVSETLVAFMVKAVVLDPDNLFNVDRTLTKQDVQKLIELCVGKLLEKESPSLDTIKMQVFFDMNYTSRREFVEEHQKVLQARLLPLCREITDSRAKTREDLEGLYDKIISYVLLRSGLGSATHITARETTAALESVFPQVELATFMSLLKKDKEQQLNELTMIVTGILLFNKDSGKGGEGIEDLPAILNEALPAASRDIENELEGTQKLAWQYTALLESLTGSDIDSAVHPNLIKKALYNVRQHEAFLKLLLADVILCAKQVEILQTELTARMAMLKAIVHTNTVVPTSQVFPHFTVVAKLWAGLQDEVLLLSTLNNMVVSLRPYLSAQAHLLGAGPLQQLLEGITIKTDLERLTESGEDRIDPVEMKSCEWFLPETTANIDKLPLQYRGVCGYTLIKKDGLLLPGNPNIGVLKHKEKFYSFSSRQAAFEFASKADEYIELVAERAKKSPELIQLLELHQQFASVTPYSQMQSGERLLVKPITKSDSSTQTDTHLLESNIVKSYEWNEWELRRKAIKLANLRGKVTRSMQTNLSHMRRHNTTQTFLPKDAACQTKRDGHSNVPKPQVYLAGLRGGETTTTHMTKVNLTRAVDE